MHPPGGEEFDWDVEFEPGLTLGLANSWFLGAEKISRSQNILPL